MSTHNSHSHMPADFLWIHANTERQTCTNNTEKNKPLFRCYLWYISQNNHTHIHKQSAKELRHPSPPLSLAASPLQLHTALWAFTSVENQTKQPLMVKAPSGVNLPPPKNTKQAHRHTRTPLMTSFLRHISYCAVINGRVMAFKKPVFSLQTRSCSPQQWLNE